MSKKLLPRNESVHKQRQAGVVVKLLHGCLFATHHIIIILKEKLPETSRAFTAVNSKVSFKEKRERKESEVCSGVLVTKAFI